jgi:hypothetical protein
VLQAPSAAGPAVTRTGYRSLLRLEAVFHFVDPDSVIARAREAGLALQVRHTEPLKSGKTFEALRFRRPGTRQAEPRRRQAGRAL